MFDDCGFALFVAADFENRPVLDDDWPKGQSGPVEVIAIRRKDIERYVRRIVKDGFCPHHINAPEVVGNESAEERSIVWKDDSLLWLSIFRAPDRYRRAFFPYCLFFFSRDGLRLFIFDNDEACRRSILSLRGFVCTTSPGSGDTRKTTPKP